MEEQKSTNMEHIRHSAHKDDTMADSLFGYFNPINRSETEKITQNDLDQMRKEIFPVQTNNKKEPEEKEEPRLWDDQSEVYSQEEMSVRKSGTYYFNENR